jgi:hypothetical protein
MLTLIKYGFKYIFTASGSVVTFATVFAKVTKGCKLQRVFVVRTFD